MTPAISKHAVPLDASTLRHAATFAGPCITLSVPPLLPGAGEGSTSQVLRSLVQTAAKQVASLRLAEAVPVLKRLEEFAAQLGAYPLEKHGFVLFCSPETSARYEAHDAEAPRLVIASHPYLKPFLSLAYAPKDVFTLCLSRKKLRLYRFAGGICHEVVLPKGVPASLEEAGAFEQPDHTLKNRSSAGPSKGSQTAVSFGTGSEREHLLGREEHFFAMVDRGLRPMLAGKSLLLAGVQEEVAAFRRVSHYEQLLPEDLAGNWDYKSEAELAQAISAAQSLDANRRASAAFEMFSEKLDRTRTLTDPDEILIGAADGRVHQLFIRRGAVTLAKLPPELDRVRLAEEDFANACACETLRHGGEVFELDEADLPSDRPMAAILRF